MALHSLVNRGYRPIRDRYRALDALNQVVGPNGCDQSGRYKAMRLLHAAAGGRLSATLAEEGGMPRCCGPAGSLHPDLLPARVWLIADASRYSQGGVTPPSPALAEAIAGDTHCHQED